MAEEGCAGELARSRGFSSKTGSGPEAESRLARPIIFWRLLFLNSGSGKVASASMCGFELRRPKTDCDTFI
eukprot:5865749-Pleurochrysis_carterae.AAC.1